MGPDGGRALGQGGVEEQEGELVGRVPSAPIDTADGHLDLTAREAPHQLIDTESGREREGANVIAHRIGEQDFGRCGVGGATGARSHI